jgi:hypothetical protein
MHAGKAAPPKKDKKSADQAQQSNPDSGAEAKPPAADGQASSPDAGAGKWVGRQLQIWRQSAKPDFGAGVFTGTSVTEEGDLRLAPALHRVTGTAETYVWCLIPDGRGGSFAGTGSHGRILRIDAYGNASTYATLPEVAVQSLARLSSGALVAGSGSNGNLYWVATDGTPTLIGSVPDRYIMALAADRSGAVYVGPGGGGTVYKVTGLPSRGAGAPRTAKIDPFFKSAAEHIMALAFDPQGRLCVGTGNDGVLYRCGPDGNGTVIYDARENAITALAIDANGDIYAGTGPKGILYKITPAGVATVLYDKATSFFTGLQPAPDGTLYASTLNSVLHIMPKSGMDVTVQPLDNPRDLDFLCIAATPDGVLAGTGNAAEIYSAGTAQPAATTAGTYESVIHDARLRSRWGSVCWTASVPAGAGVRIDTRTGDASEPDGTWSSWTAVTPGSQDAGTAQINSPPARFIQYRVTLTAGLNGAQPGLHDVSISYLPRNQPPRVTIQAPMGGERWSGAQTLRWSGDDPDHDTLTYSLLYSADGGATWRPLPADSQPVKSVPPSPAGSDASNHDLRTLEARLNADKSMPPKLKQELLDTARRQLGGGGGAAAASAPAGLHGTTKSWDTHALADGVYRLKVVASDAESNPADAETAEAVSEPFVVCNAAPRVTITRQEVNPTDRRIVIEGAAGQSLIAVTGVQYRVDGGDWIAAQPSGGMFDSGSERFVIHSIPVAPGTHKVDVEAFNAAGGSVLQTVSVTCP